MTILFVTATLAGGVAVAAEPPAPRRAEALRALGDCRGVAAAAERLACYDRAAAALDQAEAKGDIVVVDRDQARAVRRQAFGLSLPSIDLFERGESAEALATLTGRVARAHATALGKWVVALEEGGVWEQIDSGIVTRDPKPGMEVRIRRASMGSFMMSVGGQRAFRAHRVE